jgi:hypothetical protein
MENLGDTEIKYLDNKGSKLLKILTQIYNEKQNAEKLHNGTLQIATYTTGTKDSFKHF